jgi:hypothetical protein
LETSDGTIRCALHILPGADRLLVQMIIEAAAQSPKTNFCMQAALQMTSSQRQRCQVVRSSYLSSMAAIMAERQGLNALMQVGAASGQLTCLAFTPLVTAGIPQKPVVWLQGNTSC